MFLWTPAHYWPLSMRFRDDYAAAEVPMLGAVRGQSAVGLQVVLYAWATVVCSLLLVPVAPMGVLYAAAATLSGAWFIVESHRLYAAAIRGEEAAPMRVFHASITYLTLVFVALAVANWVSTVLGRPCPRSARPYAVASSMRPARSTRTTPENPVRSATPSTASWSDCTRRTYRPEPPVGTT